MKAALLHGIGDLRVDDIPTPSIGSGEVLVKMTSVGVCGSDVHYYKQGRIGNAQAVFPQALGHECAGIVAQAPKGSAFTAGQRVAVEPGLPCGTCEHCMTGHQNRCPDVQFLGSPGMQGAYAEYITCKEIQLVHLPDSVSDDEGAMLEPLGVGYHAVKLAQVSPGDSVAIFGCGPVGILTAIMARFAGASNIYMADRLSYRVDFAGRNFSIDDAIDSTKSNPHDQIMSLTHGRGVDITFDAGGEQDTVDWTLETARIGGRALIIGIPEVDHLTIDPHSMRKRELRIINVRRSNHALHPCLDLVSQKLISVGSLATHHSSLISISQAFDMVGDYADGVIRSMIIF